MFLVSKTPNFEVCPNSFVLLEDDWDDWFKFTTKYQLFFINSDLEKICIGAVKIGQFDMMEDQRRPSLPKQFDSLDDTFFSIGQKGDYYKALKSTDHLDYVLDSLKDMAKDNSLFRRASKEDVFETSLLRSVKETTVLGRYSRIINDAAELSRYDFNYIGPRQLSKKHEPIRLNFHVKPESDPPSNIHVLIGRNGVGKSFLLNAMIRALVFENSNTDDNGEFIDDDDWGEGRIFRNVISVSFSAFDKFEPLTEDQITQSDIAYAYVGLKKKRRKKNEKPGIKNLPSLAREFSLSAQNCLGSEKLKRWQRALDMLESDPIFKVARVSELAEIEDVEKFKNSASDLFRDLSSGHKIVLLTITKLVELADEGSLILLDEPEAHLHPPLLSAFVRALSDLLNNRNGVAIVATHSPVVLQEVPASCTWILERYHTLMKCERPEAETFAENVGVLTHRIFGLEVEEAGFYNLLRDAVTEFGSYEDIMERYGYEIGSEGRGLLRSLIALKNKRNLE